MVVVPVVALVTWRVVHPNVAYFVTGCAVHLSYVPSRWLPSPPPHFRGEDASGDSCDFLALGTHAEAQRLANPVVGHGDGTQPDVR